MLINYYVWEHHTILNSALKIIILKYYMKKFVLKIEIIKRLVFEKNKSL